MNIKLELPDNNMEFRFCYDLQIILFTSASSVSTNDLLVILRNYILWTIGEFYMPAYFRFYIRILYSIRYLYFNLSFFNWVLYLLFKFISRDSAKIFGPRGVCLISLIKYTLPFCILWLITNYLYIRALKELNPADVTALFSSVSAFVYIFSIALLKEKFFITRVSVLCYMVLQFLFTSSLILSQTIHN